MTKIGLVLAGKQAHIQRIHSVMRGVENVLRLRQLNFQEQHMLADLIRIEMKTGSNKSYDYTRVKRIEAYFNARDIEIIRTPRTVKKKSNDTGA